MVLFFQSEVNYGSCPFLSVLTAEARNCGGARRSVVACVNSVWNPKGDTLDALDVGPVVEVVALYLTFTCVLVFATTSEPPCSCSRGTGSACPRTPMARPGRALSHLCPALCQDGCARAAGSSPVHTIDRGTSGAVSWRAMTRHVPPCLTLRLPTGRR